MGAVSVSLSFLVFHQFLKGTYTFRCHELLCMDTIPIAARVAIAAVAGYSVYWKAKKGSLYSSDMYKLAVENRESYQ